MNIIMDQNFNVQVLLNDAVAVPADSGVVIEGGGDAAGGMPGDVLGTGMEVKDPIMSSWPFVIGISTVTLAVSIALGLLLAKRKIKKGYELYED